MQRNDTQNWRLFASTSRVFCFVLFCLCIVFLQQKFECSQGIFKSLSGLWQPRGDCVPPVLGHLLGESEMDNTGSSPLIITKSLSYQKLHPGQHISWLTWVRTLMMGDTSRDSKLGCLSRLTGLDLPQIYSSVCILFLFTNCVALDKSFSYYKFLFLLLFMEDVFRNTPKALISCKAFEWISVFQRCVEYCKKKNMYIYIYTYSHTCIFASFYKGCR